MSFIKDLFKKREKPVEAEDHLLTPPEPEFTIGKPAEKKESPDPLPPSPPESLLRERPFEVKLLKAPDEDSEAEFEKSVYNAYTLIKNHQFVAAEMLFDIIQLDYDDLKPILIKKNNLALDVYNEIRLYILINKTYALAMKRDIDLLKQYIFSVSYHLKELDRKKIQNARIFNYMMNQYDDCVNILEEFRKKNGI